MFRSAFSKAAAAILVALLFPAAASAQSAIVGTVKDTSGAVLPGVSVEASSPALIEKSREVISDEHGGYRIIDLRPGAYALTFTLPGFRTVKRELELPSNFTATINAEMPVGAVEQTVPVAAEPPLVDLQAASRTQVLTREAMDQIPS